VLVSIKKTLYYSTSPITNAIVVQFAVLFVVFHYDYNTKRGDSIAKWLVCLIHVQKAWVQIAVATLSCNSLRQTAHTHCASVYQAAKLVAALLRVAGVTAGLAESNGSLLMLSNMTFLMIFAVFDPSPLTLWINCSF